MGIYDRDYYREDDSRSVLGGQSMVWTIIVANVAIFLINLFLGKNQLVELMELNANDLWQPLRWWHFLSYGFAHDPDTIVHVGFNMFGLWLFGTDVEGIYGRKEFLRLYLTMIVFSGLVWAVTENVIAPPKPPNAIGASGAITGVMVLYVMHFPRRMFYIWGIFPLPAWALASLWLIEDVAGALNNVGRVAHSAHLAGALFGLIYFRTGWTLGRLWPERLSNIFRSRPKLKIHDDEPPQDWGKQVDAILEKISRQGEASLTEEERRTLKDASQRLQRRRQ